MVKRMMTRVKCERERRGERRGGGGEGTGRGEVKKERDIKSEGEVGEET